MTDRADVERKILEEESMLAQVARLLERGVSLAEWPERARDALGLALADPAMPRAETWKAVALRRHLFGPSGAVPAQIAAPPEPSAPSSMDRRYAERLRASLAAVVRYRGATGLR